MGHLFSLSPESWLSPHKRSLSLTAAYVITSSAMVGWVLETELVVKGEVTASVKELVGGGWQGVRGGKGAASYNRKKKTES